MLRLFETECPSSCRLAPVPRSFPGADVLAHVMAFLDPFGRLAVRRVSREFDVVSRQHVATSALEELSATYAGSTWDFSEIEESGDLLARHQTRQRPVVAWACQDKRAPYLVSRGNMEFDPTAAEPLLLALGMPRALAVRGVPSAAAMERLLRHPWRRGPLAGELALEIGTWSTPTDTAADVARALHSVALRVSSLLWWNPDVSLDAALCTICTMRQLQSLTLVLHGAEFVDSTQLCSLATLQALPRLSELTILSSATTVPTFFSRPGARKFGFDDAHQLRHLAAGICKIVRLEELNFPELHSKAKDDDPYTVSGCAVFVTEIVTCMPRLTHLGTLPCCGEFWRLVQVYAKDYASAVCDWRLRPKLHLEVSCDRAYADDINALVECIITTFPGLSIHLEIHLVALLFGTGRDTYVYETDIDTRGLAGILCKLEKTKAETIEISLDTNVPGLDPDALDAALAAHGIELANFTQFL